MEKALYEIVTDETVRDAKSVEALLADELSTTAGPWWS